MALFSRFRFSFYFCQYARPGERRSFRIRSFRRLSHHTKLCPHTNILSTQFSSDEGEFVVLDYMPCYRSQDETGHYLPAELYRYIHWIKGKPRFKINYHPAPNYAQGQVILNITPQYIESYCSFDNKDRQYLYASLSLQDIKEKKKSFLKRRISPALL